MIYIGAFIALQVIVLVAYWLMKKNNPQGVLMVAGILMLALSMLLGMHSLSLTETTGTPVFDLFRIIKETFSSNMLRVGLMIMTIGGYVAYMKRSRLVMHWYMCLCNRWLFSRSFPISLLPL